MRKKKEDNYQRYDAIDPNVENMNWQGDGTNASSSTL